MRRSTFFGSGAAVAAGAAVCALLAQVGLGAFGAAAAPAAPLVASAPLSPTISRTAIAAYHRVPNLVYECSLDEGGYQACPTPATFGGLGRAQHTLRVRAVKPGGAASRPSSYSWTVVARRRHPPSTSSHLRPVMTTAPVRPWISRNATFAWLLVRRTSAECRLDGAGWKRCASPTTYLALDLGPHVFRVRARTASGRRSAVNRFLWTIADSSAPAPPEFTAGPEGASASTDATITFEVADDAAAECRLDGGPWLACASPVVYVGLAAGSHTFCVRAVTAGGTTGPEACLTWIVTPPAEGPPGPTEPTGLFSITGDVPGLLRPGSGGPVPLTVTNPFPFDLRVTGLGVSVLPGSSRPGCDGAANLQVTQSNTAGGAVSIVVPALGSVTLPTQGATAPFLTMLDLPTDQNACKGATFVLSYSGTGTKA